MPASLLADDFVARLARLEILSRRLLSGRLRGQRPPQREKRSHSPSLQLADRRDYCPGDDPRFIDWNLCARSDRLAVKVFAQERRVTIHLLADASQSCNYGDPNKLHFIKQAAAAIGVVALASGQNVEVSAMNNLALSSGALRGRAGMPRLLGFLDPIPSGGQAQFAASFERAARNRGSGAVFVVLSDFLTSEDLQPNLALLAAGGNDLVCIHVISPQELTPPIGGAVRLVDAETGRESDITVNPRSLGEYQRELQRRRSDVEQAVVARGGDYVFARTDTPIESLLFDRLPRGGILLGV